MKNFVYYSVLIATFIVLWALMITIFVVLENFGYKAGGFFSVYALLSFSESLEA